MCQMRMTHGSMICVPLNPLAFISNTSRTKHGVIAALVNDHRYSSAGVGWTFSELSVGAGTFVLSRLGNCCLGSSSLSFLRLDGDKRMDELREMAVLVCGTVEV